MDDSFSLNLSAHFQEFQQLKEEVKQLRIERLIFLMMLTKDNPNGVVRIPDRNVIAMAMNDWNIESYKDIENRCTVIRLVKKKPSAILPSFG